VLAGPLRLSLGALRKLPGRLLKGGKRHPVPTLAQAHALLEQPDEREAHIARLEERLEKHDWILWLP
jgi:hypothetical protein